MYFHVVARTTNRAPAFRNANDAWWLWQRLRDAFPDAVAGCLMPNHLHLIVAGDPDAIRLRLSKVLSGFTRFCGLKRLWDPVPRPEPVRDAKHLARQVRYVILNPCRAGLVADPACWPWSTYRDAIGAVHQPWVTLDRLARALGKSPNGLRAAFHEYVSSDPSVRIDGTPLPIGAPHRETPLIPLPDIIQAGESATRLCARSVRRRLCVLLAMHQGWRDVRVLAETLDVHPVSIRRLSRSSDPELLSAGALCLGDARLREHPDPSSSSQHATATRAA